MTRFLSIACAFLLLPAITMAEDQSSDPSEVFRVSGPTLIYDTESHETEYEIDSDHIEMLLDHLRRRPEISTLVLNSGGGSLWAGEEMARIVLDFELNTVVDGECSSSCVTMFLAGDQRKMERGSKIGFHSPHWSEESIEGYYNRNREDSDWDDPFEFASWVYEDTRAEVYEDLRYLLERGFDPLFAVDTLQPRENLWYPSRRELRNGGVVTE